MNEPLRKTIDYNGTGEWTLLRIRERYGTYCKELGIAEWLALEPREHDENGTHWVYPIMDEMIARMEVGDRASIAIGVDLIEEDQRMVFGRILKSNTARALRRQTLTDEQQERIRRRVVAMYIPGNIGREFREYNKLLKKVGLGTHAAELEEKSHATILMRCASTTR